jgi:hypothetical protein
MPRKNNNRDRHHNSTLCNNMRSFHFLFPWIECILLEILITKYFLTYFSSAEFSFSELPQRKENFPNHKTIHIFYCTRLRISEQNMSLHSQTSFCATGNNTPITTYTRSFPGAPSKKRSFAVSQASYPAIVVAPSLEMEPEEADPSINFFSSFHEVATPNQPYQEWVLAGLVIETIPTTTTTTTTTTEQDNSATNN